MGIVARDDRKMSLLVDDLRSDQPGGHLTITTCDVTDIEPIQPAFEEAVRGLGQLDPLVYCPGSCPRRAGTLDNG